MHKRKMNTRTTCNTLHKNHWVQEQHATHCTGNKTKTIQARREDQEPQRPTSQRHWPTGLALVRLNCPPSSVGVKYLHQDFTRNGQGGGGGIGAKYPLEPPLHPCIRRHLRFHSFNTRQHKNISSSLLLVSSGTYNRAFSLVCCLGTDVRHLVWLCTILFIIIFIHSSTFLLSL
jgi:hypothetical protein